MFERGISVGFANILEIHPTRASDDCVKKIEIPWA